MIPVIYILVFGFLTWKMPFFHLKGIKRKWLLAAFSVKLLAGALLMWIYTVYYPDKKMADVYKFYTDARIMYEGCNEGIGDYLKMLFGIDDAAPYFKNTYYARMDHWYRVADFGMYNSDRTMIRINAFLLLFSGGNIYAHMIVLAFVSFTGLLFLYRSFIPFIAGKEKLLFACLFFEPAVLLWATGILKEGIALFALGYFFFSFFDLVNKKRFYTGATGIVLSLGLLFLIKTFLLFTVVPAAVVYLIAHRSGGWRTGAVYFIFYLVLGGFLFLWPMPRVGQWFLQNACKKQQDFKNWAKGGVFVENKIGLARIDPRQKYFIDTLAPGRFKVKKGASFMYWRSGFPNDTIFVKNNSDTSTFVLVNDVLPAKSVLRGPETKPRFFSFLKEMPRAFYNGFCAPLKFRGASAFEILAGVESILLTGFMVFCFVFKGKNRLSNPVLLALAVSIPVFLVIGYTVPVSGAIVRYRSVALPFILMAALVLFDPEHFLNWVSRSRKPDKP